MPSSWLSCTLVAIAVSDCVNKMKIFGFALFCLLLVFVQASKKQMCNEASALAGDPNSMCMGFMQQWSYDASKNDCVEFIYGGCGGNDNRFATKKECENVCKD